MKKPVTFEELLELVNPLDLDEIFSFSGRNDHSDTKYYDLRQKYSLKILESMKMNWSETPNWRHPHLYTFFEDSIEDFYETLIRCIQDFYWWGHKFHHIYSNVYKRVMNALEIKIEEINKWSVEDERNKI